MKFPRLARIWRRSEPAIFFMAALLAPLQATDTAAFTDHCAKLSSTAGEKGQRAIPAADGWVFLQAELAHLGRGPLTPEVCGPAVESIAAYHKSLHEIGVQLLLLPIPTKAEIFPDKLVPDSPADLLANRLDEFLKLLKQREVSVIPLREALKKDREGSYCRTDSHWSPKGAELAAKLVREAWQKEIGTQSATASGKTTNLQIEGDLLGEPHTAKIPRETIPVNPVSGIAASDSSPYVVIGDSHTLVFSAGASLGFHCEGAGFPDHLQLQFRSPFQQISAPADGAYQARIKLRDKARGEFWASKKLVVWAFSVREITDGNWKPVAIQRATK